MSEEKLTPVEEQAIDALLDEMLGKVESPDLSQKILFRLHETPAEVKTFVPRKEPIAEIGENRSKMPVKAVFAVIATLAAMFAAAVALQPVHDLPKGKALIAGNDSASGESGARAADALENLAGNPIDHDGAVEEVKPESPKRQPPRGVPLVVESRPPKDPQPSLSESTPPDLGPRSFATLEAVELVSEKVDEELRDYWDAVGIETSADASRQDVASRLRAVLGTEISPEAIFDAERLQTDLSRPQVARSVARRWLMQITGGGIQRIKPEARDGLINEVTTNFQSKRKFDKTLSAWIDGTSKNSLAFYSAVSAGPKHLGGHDAMTHRVAALTMNVDLRCTRCHDSLIKGNGTQQDYWSFAAFLRRGVKRTAEGGLEVDPSSKAVQPLFYDLPDGRQRVAEPAVAQQWMKSPADQPIEKVSQWARQMVGSPELARGVVNSLWQLVHGQPLQGRIVDPISAPHNEALDRLEEKLTQDLLDSQFDVARTLALIIAAPATRRAVPKPLQPENAWVSSDVEYRKAMNAVDAFAASLPSGVNQSLNQRVDESLRAIGAKIDLNGRPFVAQVGAASDGETDKGMPASTLSSDFPARANSLPVQWLKLIEDEQSRIDHLGYLAGMSDLPPNISGAVDAMHAAKLDSNLLLHRVWWMIKP